MDRNAALLDEKVAVATPPFETTTLPAVEATVAFPEVAVIVRGPPLTLGVVSPPERPTLAKDMFVEPSAINALFAEAEPGTALAR